MALQLRRGLEADRDTITPAAGELIYTTDKKEVFVGDGATLGGKRISYHVDKPTQYTVGTGGDFPDIYAAVDFANMATVSSYGRLHLGLLPGTHVLNKTVRLHGDWARKRLSQANFHNTLATSIVFTWGASSITKVNADKHLNWSLSTGFNDLNAAYKSEKTTKNGTIFNAVNPTRDLQAGDILVFSDDPGTAASTEFSNFVRAHHWEIISVAGDSFVLQTLNYLPSGAVPAYLTTASSGAMGTPSIRIHDTKVIWDVASTAVEYYQAMFELNECHSFDDYETYDPPTTDPENGFGWWSSGLTSLAILSPTEADVTTAGYPYMTIDCRGTSSMAFMYCLFARNPGVSDVTISAFDTYLSLSYLSTCSFYQCFLEYVEGNDSFSYSPGAAAGTLGPRATFKWVAVRYFEVPSGVTADLYDVRILDGIGVAGTLSMNSIGISVFNQVTGAYVGISTQGNSFYEAIFANYASPTSGIFYGAYGKEPMVVSALTNTVSGGTYAVACRHITRGQPLPSLNVSGVTTLELPIFSYNLASAGYGRMFELRFYKTDTNTLTITCTGGTIVGATTTTKPGLHVLLFNGLSTWYSPF